MHKEIFQNIFNKMPHIIYKRYKEFCGVLELDSSFQILDTKNEQINSVMIKHMKKYLKIIQLRKEKNKEQLEQIVPKNSYDISKMQTLTKTDMKS
ncbi:hypothetical protein Avbf_05867 [Armadillidium vulgare]|nr:hypothetical protein Avbf_05867 [Armadillidium vulgare]